MSATLQAYTLLHVLISLAGIASGFVVMAQLGWGGTQAAGQAGKQLSRSRFSAGWTGFFLATTFLTSLTGFGFPFHGVTPGHVLGLLSFVALAAAAHGLYRRHLVGPWRIAFVAGAFLAQYFNVFVLIVQSFQKIPALHALAPTQTEGPFADVQLLTLITFVAWGLQAARHFHPNLATATPAGATAAGQNHSRSTTTVAIHA
jgi:hypothetical protein